MYQNRDLTFWKKAATLELCTTEGDAGHDEGSGRLEAAARGAIALAGGIRITLRCQSLTRGGTGPWWEHGAYL